MDGPGSFPTTRWSQVLAAREDPSRDRNTALAELCEAYWQPLYSYARRRGHPRDEALDLVQGFFGRLLEKRYLDDVRVGSGRFRGFLLAALKHDISKVRARARALKRGGDRVILPLDGERGERHYRLEPADDASPERAFERSWALALLERVRGRLGEEQSSKGRGHLYEALTPALLGATPRRTHREVARALGMSEDAVKMALSRLRKRFGALLREEVAQTVDSDEEVEAEIRYLLAAVGG